VQAVFNPLGQWFPRRVPQKFKHPNFSIFIAIKMCFEFTLLSPYYSFHCYDVSKSVQGWQVLSRENWNNGQCDRGATEY
jgi:hypothetical protein